MSYIQLKTVNGKNVPMKNVKINVDIHNHVAQFTLTQLYHNTEKTPIETFYTFPTPAYASVFDFSAKIGEKIIKTVLKEKEEAKNEYNKAISEGNGGFYMERINSDIFSVSLGNIKPDTEIEITIKYIVELQTQINANQLRVNIPLTIMPKYGSFNDITSESLLQTKLANPTKTNEKPYELSISGIINMHDGIISVDSKTCKIKFTDMKETNIHFEINDLENLGEDIIMVIERNTPKSSCLIQKADDLKLTNELFRYATMVNIVPKFDDILTIDPVDVHYVMLLDSSGSMGGKDIENCKQGAKLFLLSLPSGSSFDIYQFNYTFSKFEFSNDCVYSDKISGAIEWIDKIQAYGGTELIDALEDVYSTIKKINKRSMILLLSDGGVSNTTDVLRLAKRNKNTSIFTIGIGQSVSQSLIQELADVSNGKAEFVNSGTDQIKEKILAQLRRSQINLGKCHKDNGIQINVDGPYKMVPESIPTLYENDINTFFVFSENPIKSINYIQTFDSYVLNNNVPLTTLNPENKNYVIHRMAGIKVIGNLNNNPMGSKIEHLKSDPYKSAIIESSLNFGILSNYTSFIGVEVREEVDKTTQECKLIEIPLQTAKKYSVEPYGHVGHIGNTGPCGPCGPRGSIGINTIGSGLKNASHDLRGAPSAPKFVVSPWLNSTIECDTNLKSISNNHVGLNNHVSLNNHVGLNNHVSLNKHGPTKDHIFDVERYLPREVDDDWFDVQPEKISVKNRHLINITKPIGINTMGTKLKNINPSNLSKTYKTSATINSLPEYIKFDNILTAVSVGFLTNSNKLKVNDYVTIASEGVPSGIYKIWSLGSENEKWVIEKVQ